MSKEVEKLASLLNLGEKTAGWLIEAGVVNYQQMVDLGAVEVAKRVLLIGHKANLIFVYAVEGAISNEHWHKLDFSRRNDLKSEFAIVRRDVGKK